MLELIAPAFNTVHASVSLFIEVIGSAFFLLAGLSVPAPTRLQWLGWGLFLWSVAVLLPF
jgi:hypothetical protein